jgi:hypothetical protein
MKRTLNVDINGKVSKVSSKNPLLPLFEAVVNSIQALEKSKKPQITIEILRDASQGELDLQDGTPAKVSGFIVSDNGAGFDDINIDSFCTSDSTLKSAQGGKGVGRFSWLKFFGSVEIDSTFSEGKSFFNRKFLFDKNGVDNDDKAPAKTSEVKTVVSLTKMFPQFLDKCPRSIEVIADRLVEHLLSYFATSSCPPITLKDGPESITLQTLYRKNFGDGATNHKFEIRGQKFRAIGLRLHQGNQVHKLLLCADKRVAESMPLKRFDPILGRKIEDAEGNSFAYCVFVEGEYLDSIVNDDREGLRFPDDGDDENPTLDSDIRRSEIVESILPKVLGDLSEELKQVKESNVVRVGQYIERKAPEYRVVAKLHPEKVEQINKSTDKEIDSELRKIQFDIESKLRDEARQILEMATESDKSADEFEAKTKKFLEVVNDLGKASLSKYVVQRRVILDILKKRMESGEAGKYHLEKAIHELIFPLGATSDDVEYERQNLWIIDERLSYHSYLGSDKTISATPAEASSSLEPDIIIFNRPIALDNQNDTGRAFESIEIVEFKRPGRDDYTDADNPALQVMKYIETIKEGREKNRRGRPIEVTPTTHFYCYVMCDITEKLRKILKRIGFLEAPDGQGLFHYAQNHNAYIEVMSYNKMLRLAEQRNKILFEKLHIK